jgi:cellulose synthase (UDP-forming)
MRTQMAYSFCHALAITHKLTGRTKGWVATGAVKKSSSLARTISIIGCLTILANLGVAWPAWLHDVDHYGLHNFWAMGLFLIGYTYLAVPLFIEFLRVLGLLKPSKRLGGRDDGPQAHLHDIETNKIALVEAVAYTVLIGFLTIVATGRFDLIIPWGRQ